VGTSVPPAVLEDRQLGKLMNAIMGPDVESAFRAMPAVEDPAEMALLREFDPHQWLNGTAINWFLSAIECRRADVISVDSYFCTKMLEAGMTYEVLQRQNFMKRSRSRVFANSRLMLFPFNETAVNMDNPRLKAVHWTIIVADIKRYKLVYLDSCGSEESKCRSTASPKFLAISRFLRQRGKSATAEGALDHWWRYEYGGSDIPRQMDGSACGKFICAYAGMAAARGPDGGVVDSLVGCFEQKHVVRLGCDMSKVLKWIMPPEGAEESDSGSG
jgi:hypothetical protein